jgi:hypothetical protein
MTPILLNLHPRLSAAKIFSPEGDAGKTAKGQINYFSKSS